MIQEISHQGEPLALIIPHNFDEPGVRFFTPDTLALQLAHMHHPAGKVIAPHVHNAVPRQVRDTLEVLFIRGGKLRVDFYSPQQQYLQSRVLSGGDILLLLSGGHGFEVLEEVTFFEVKQGPYAGEGDKTRFAGVSTDRIHLVD